MSPDADENVVAVPEAQQRLNSLIFIVNNSLIYLVAPVLYVGVLHAAILAGAGASDALANLPSSVSTWMMPLPVLVSWLFPSKRHFRWLWMLSYLLMGGAGLLVAALCWGRRRWHGRRGSCCTHAASAARTGS
ncbi:MAG: hypothetical protein U0992_13150 [Planctomycetaceae bacterium]